MKIPSAWESLAEFVRGLASFARHRLLIVAGFILLGYGAIIFYMVYPGLQYGSDYNGNAQTLDYVERVLGADPAFGSIVSSAQKNGLREPARISLQPNPFLELVYRADVFSVKRNNDTEPSFSTPRSARIQIRWDSVVVATAMLFVVLGIAYALLQWSLVAEPSASSGRTGDAKETAVLDSHDRVLVHQMNIAWARARNADLRALTMLGAGVLFAMMGIAAFYYMVLSIEAATQHVTSANPVPAAGAVEVKPVSSEVPLWLIYLRPLSVLVAAELIAFFLLRQYRSLIDDQKWFFKIFVRRGNFLAAAQLTSVPDRASGLDAVVAMLLSEQFSTRLGKDETTEELKAGETEANALNALLGSIGSLFRGAQAGKAG